MTDCITVVENLSQREKNSILSVLQRDEQLRNGQEQKISDLRLEINKIRMCSVLRSGDDQSKMCLRCRAEMGILFNRGALCPSCKFKVCKTCQEVMFNGSWLCKLCYKQRQLKWLTGEWAASFEQNPLRKWASGSDLIKSSLKLVPGTTSIEIDEPPSNREAGNQDRKVSRNGVKGSDHGRTRVEVPKEGDQLKLSELFNVLRVKKPDEVPAQETKVRRVVTSRKYSESDSDSSSNSDEEVRSTSTAPSVTESELDVRRFDSPRMVESPPPHQVIESRLETESPRRPAPILKVQVTPDNFTEDHYKPVPAPRSPKPADRRKAKSEHFEQEISAPAARPRTKHKTSNMTGHSGEPEDQMSMSKSMIVQSSSSNQPIGEIDYLDKTSINSELSVHVANTRESLDKKREIEISKSQMSLDKHASQPVEVIVRQKSKDHLLNESGENVDKTSSLGTNIGQKEGKNTEKIKGRNKSDYQLDKNSGAELDIRKSASKSQISIKSSSSKDTLKADDSQQLVSSQKETIVKSDKDMSAKAAIDTEKAKLTREEHLPVPRAGSPYSVSMDSIPSSHPSPTFLRSSASSNHDSSDTDSISRLSHMSENIPRDGGSPAREGKGEDIVVEHISKVHFKRMTKKVAQLEALAKLTKSPNKKMLAGSRDSPQTVSECSVSHDDSGNVSGGSRGNTPEHRRTDSSYSQSSIPSTLSTDEEDIDRAVARVQNQAAGNRGNLLSVFGDSRESLASYYSDAGDIAYSNIPVTGEILFSLNYNYKTSMLEVGVKQCRDIAVADSRRRRSDPYVKTYLLPDRTRGGKRKTKVKKHTLSPTFDETLKYSITKSELENRTLWITVWHNDRFGRNVFLGEVTINFDYFKFEDPFPRWYPLQERMDAPPASMMVYKGDMSLCIRFVPADKLSASPSVTPGKHKKETGGKGQLQVKVKEARNLTAVKSNGFSDPFCKGYLLPERHKSSKQKTAVIKKDCNPTWNHTFIFEDVTLAELRERCLELTIWDYEKLSSNDFLGGVRLNLGTGLSQGKSVEWMDARGEEMSMWQAMLDRPNIWIDGALILRPNMEKRKY